MSFAYEKSGDWRALGVVAGFHVLAVFALLNIEPVANAMGLQQPLMVSLLTVSEPEPPKEPPKPLPPKLPVQEVKPMPPPPVLAVREEIPSPVTVAPQPPDPVPLPAVLPPPPPPAPVKQVAVAATSVAGPVPTPAPIIAPRFDADYLDNPAPAYPALSRRMGEHGRVLLRVHVTADGSPAQIEVRESSGFERLDKAARETVLRWRFAPARQGDRGVAAWVLVPISFSLRS